MARANGARHALWLQRFATNASSMPSLTRSRRPPPLWLVLATTATLVSLVVYAWPWLRLVVTAAPPHRQPWWFVTALFVHVDHTVVPLYGHLLTNVALIGFFGRIVERRLGSARNALLVVAAVAAQLAVSLGMGAYGDGTSGTAWAFMPPALVSVIVRTRREAGGLLRSATWWTAVGLWLWAWVVVSAASALVRAHSTNVWHLVAAVVGGVFAFVWRRRRCGRPRR